MNRKIVMLEGKAFLADGISLDRIRKYGDLKVYTETKPNEVIQHIGDANFALVDKVPINEAVFDACKNLEYIGITATGYDNVDLSEAKKHGVVVSNVPGYSTDSVAQHTFALILEITNKVALLNQKMKKGYFEKDSVLMGHISPKLLSGKSIGIIGYGNIGRKVGEIANAFGMKVNIYSKDKETTIKSDIITLHCPLTNETSKMIDSNFISKMKEGAILINTARGGLLDEAAVAQALERGRISYAGIDVLTHEPPSEEQNSPLVVLQNVVLTPHIAWATIETRQRLIDMCADNIQKYLDGAITSL